MCSLHFHGSACHSLTTWEQLAWSPWEAGNASILFLLACHGPPLFCYYPALTVSLVELPLRAPALGKQSKHVGSWE